MAANINHWRGIHGMLTPELVKKYASQGMTLKEIAKLYGCTRENISHSLASDDELKEAWEVGHTELLIEYTAQLKKRAFENDTLLMFALKTQCGCVEQQYVVGKDLEKKDIHRVNIYLPHNNRDDVVVSDE